MKGFREYAKRMACPCGQGVFEQCCGRFLLHGEEPQNALELMRSRYSAYYLQEEDYLKRTWFPTTRPSGILIDKQNGIKWMALEIIRHDEQDGEAMVEFVARYKVVGKAQKLHEVSRFIRDEGRWFYLDGEFPSD